MLNRDRLIVALDVSSATQARQIVQSIGESASTYKIGKQLFTAEGPQIVRDLVSSGRKVFLDLKFHDIPNTVAGAVAEAAKLGVSMLTVHASGGSKMLKAAADAAAQSASKPMVLAVTVLTSLSDADLSEIGFRGDVITQVIMLGTLARKAGCGGLVASAKEARELRRELGNDFAIVTPGVRPSRHRRRRPGPSPHPERSHRRRRNLPGGRQADSRSRRSSPSRGGDRQRNRLRVPFKLIEVHPGGSAVKGCRRTS